MEHLEFEPAFVPAEQSGLPLLTGVCQTKKAIQNGLPPSKRAQLHWRTTLLALDNAERAKTIEALEYAERSVENALQTEGWLSGWRSKHD